jgi:hypothetical protein
MKTDMKKKLTIVLCVLILLVGCGPQQSISPAVNTDVQQSGNWETANSPIPAPTAQQGFDVREPKDDRERFAMVFAENLFLVAHNPLSSSRADFGELVTYVDIDSIGPLAPRSPTNEELGLLITQTFFARVTENGEIQYADTGIIWVGSDAPKGVGVIDVKSITQGTLTAVAIDVREENIVAILVDVKPVSGGYAASPLSRPIPQNPSPLDQPIVFSAPHGSIVEHNGEVVTPVVVESIGKHDFYELHGAYRGRAEDISVFCGDAIGTIEGTIIGDTSAFGGSSRGYSGYSYATYSIRYDIAALAMTRGEFRPLRDAITERTQALVTQIGELLDANDMDGFVDMTHGYGELINNNGTIKSEYRGFFTSWQRSDSVHGAEREITINAIEIRGSDSLRVKFSTLLTLASGRKFTADSTIVFDYIDGVWLIYDMTNEIFKSDSRTWSIVD